MASVNSKVISNNHIDARQVTQLMATNLFHFFHASHFVVGD